jgi:hypothetical protein
MEYTVYQYDRRGKLIQSKAVTSASDIEAFETARNQVIRDREELLSEVAAAPIDNAA